MDQKQMQEWKEYYRSLKEAYESGSDQFCYQTEAGEVCEPLTVWTKLLVVLLSNVEKIVDAVNERRLEQMRALLFEDFQQRRLNRENLRKLVRYFALCYSKLNDGDETKEFQSYGKRVESLLTPDRQFCVKSGNSPRKKDPKPLSLQDYQRAYQNACTDRRNATSEAGVSGFSLTEEDNRFLALVSSVPVFLLGTESGVIDTSEGSTMNKCNVYVSDVLFGVLCALAGLVDPKREHCDDLHRMLINKWPSKGKNQESSFFSSSGKPHRVYEFFLRSIALVQGKKPTLIKLEGKPKSVSSVYARGITEEPDQPIQLEPYAYLDFLVKSCIDPKLSGTKFEELSADAEVVNDFHHVEIYVSSPKMLSCEADANGKPKTVSNRLSISAHKYATTIADQKTQTKQFQFALQSATFSASFKEAGTYARESEQYGVKKGDPCVKTDKDVHIAYVSLLDMIETLFQRYCSTLPPETSEKEGTAATQGRSEPLTGSPSETSESEVPHG